MIIVKKGDLYVLSAWPPRSSFTKNMLGSLQLSYSRVKTETPAERTRA